MPSQSKFYVQPPRYYVHPDCDTDTVYGTRDARGCYPGAITNDEYDAMTPEQLAEWSKDPVAYVNKKEND